MQTFAVVLVLVSCGLSCRGMVIGKEKCDPDRLAVYRIVLDTHWSRDLFPKQYPEVRPPAQWSKLVGRSHDQSFSLFSIGAEASKGLQMFAETGRSDALEEQSQGENGVCDEFNGPPIASGRGRSETDFFIDGNHTRVSVVSRIVPSPDWFIGLDGLDLCSGGFWIDAIAVEVNPLDAGTDDGFTFSAPNWPSEPRRKVTRITSKEPRHPANSFFYPALDQLPTIATFHLIKEKVYKLSSDQRREGSLPTNRSLTMADLEAVLHQEEISNDLAPAVPISASPPRKQHRNKHMRKGGRRPAVACEVGHWEAWGPCSVSCGVGDQSRKRSVTKHARRGGRPCPPLVESRWCGEHTECPQNFFNW